MATRWFPDTCSCVLVYEAVDNGEKLDAVQIEHACELHGGEGELAKKWSKKKAQQHLDKVLAHNRARPDKLKDN